MSYRTKTGKHGTLYLYAIRYEDSGREFYGTWRCWAYSSEDALERFYSGPDDEGWTALKWALVSDSPIRHWHEV